MSYLYNSLDLRRPSGKPWFQTSGYMADGISPTLDLDFRNNRYASNGASRALANIIPPARSSTATYVGPDGLIKTAATNELRYAYDPETLAFKGAMFEPQSTNLAINSSDCSAAAWTKIDVTVNSTYGTAPDGTTTSNLITEGSAGTAISYQQCTIASGSTNTWSVFLRYTSGAQWVRVFVYDQTAPSNQIRAWVNIQNRTLGTVSAGAPATGAAARIKLYPNGWMRVSITGVLSTATTVNCSVSSAISDGSTTKLSNSTYQVWGGQFENKSFMTSYIPTAGATVTRAPDTCSAPMAPFVSRAGTATYRDYDGILQTASMEEVRYDYSGPFPSVSAVRVVEPSATNTSWANTYTTIGVNTTKNNVNGPDGVLNSADTFSANAALAPHYVYGSSTASVIGQPYVISQFVKYVSGPVYAQLATSSSIGTAQIYANFDMTTGTLAGAGTDVTGAGVEAYAGGWYRIWMSFVAAGAGVGAGVIIGSVDSPSTARLGVSAGNGTFYIYGSQFEEGGTPSSYIPTTTSAVTRPADIIQGASSNLLRMTHQLTNSVWQKVTCAVTDGQTDPYGTSLASLITDSAGNSYIAQISQTLSANKTVTFSVWVKTDTKSGSIRLRIRDSISFTSVGDIYIAPTTSWVRYSVTGTFDNTYTGNIEVIIDPVDTTAGTYYLFGPQLEIGTAPSPIIVSHLGSSVFSSAGAYNWYNQKAGTMFIDMEYEGGTGSSYPMVFRFDDTTSNSRINTYYNTSGNFIGSDAQIGGGQYGYISAKDSSRIDTSKYVQAYRTNNARAADEGTLLGVDDTSGVVPDVYISRVCDSPSDLTCYVREIRYYPIRLSNTELQRIST